MALSRKEKDKTTETELSNYKHWSKICSFSKEADKRVFKMSYGIPLDMSMDSMEETRFKKKHAPLLQKLVKKLHFSYVELECIMLIYYKLQKDGAEKAPGITRMQFRDVLHCGFDMTDDTLMDRIFPALEKGNKIAATVPVVSMETWASALSLFLRGTLEEKIQYCFSVYDSSGNGLLIRDTMFQLLRNSLISTTGDDDSDEGVKDMADVILKKMDLDRDLKLSYNDYRTSVLQTPMLLEALGPCLPSRMAVNAFLTSFTQLVGKV